MFENIYKDKHVLVTGHTGFKGTWLCTWLLELGAKVAGYSVDVPTEPSHFEVLGLSDRIEHFQGDVRHKSSLDEVFNKFQPEIVFHLAAQPLVKRSYDDPILTFETNSMGTLNLLECLRNQPSVVATVLITSDKCYENVEWLWGYRENDRLGGKDPYSASKACAEVISRVYTESFFGEKGPFVATTRAGNVVGGGDWALDRVVPDCMRAWSKGEKVVIRNPHATRPWQHVLEPLSGYLVLGQKLFQGVTEVKNESFNFGPSAKVNQSVGDLIADMAQYWPGAEWKFEQEVDPGKPESTLLRLNCDKAFQLLNWNSVLNFSETIRMTGEWYQIFYSQEPLSVSETTTRQIEEYTHLATQSNLVWTQ
ncbi:MAG: CDP-glucose 4,6-dehydratase [Nitrospina sp.]|nr:CDP-glucose 4,6-dehydratase [Nitrospina sp.]|tara:strand:+ start:10263 stop:11357 length:1095 start_codon:yes stop_codon:yes gene_type:complete